MISLTLHFVLCFSLKANGLDEHFNQTIQTILVKYCHSKPKYWNHHLDSCVFAYNTSRHNSTKFTPFQLMFGRRAVLPIDIDICQDSGVKALSNELQYVEDSQEKVLKSNIAILEEATLNVLQAQQKQKEHYDKKLANPHSYSIGTKVLLKDFKRKKTKGGKLLIRWKGPYTIVKLLGRGTYMLSDANSNTVRAIASHIKPFISDFKTENSVNQQHMRIKGQCVHGSSKKNSGAPLAVHNMAKEVKKSTEPLGVSSKQCEQVYVLPCTDHS